MKKINIALFLLSIFFISACTAETSSPSNEYGGEVLGVEIETKFTEEGLDGFIEEVIEVAEVIEEIVEEEIIPVENIPTPIVTPPVVQEKKYVTPPEPTLKLEPIKTAPASNCHSGYSGCLKANASDYDCAAGSGNGPYYTGLVQVFGSDPFGLDRDKDGWGCE